ncbi:hypothetical protein C8J57DRAFT_1517615 [Mycena rebaudengoi]|nr:hypothetical protein C8J57DRAFT_1517615 [Mycena rebaudengoi]
MLVSCCTEIQPWFPLVTIYAQVSVAHQNPRVTLSSSHSIAAALVLARPACSPPSSTLPPPLPTSLPRLCHLIAHADTPATLALLRDHDGPPSRLVLRAFLRAADAPPCYCSPTLLSPPHASTLTLNTALDALLTQLVSHPVLRLVTTLLVAARRLLVHRRADTVTHLWQTLLAQYEWIVAARLVLERHTSSKHPVNNRPSPKL